MVQSTPSIGDDDKIYHDHNRNVRTEINLVQNLNESLPITSTVTPT